MPAHLSLFHALPGAELPAIEAALREAAAVAPFPLAHADWRSLGRGVACRLASPVLDRLHAELARRFAAGLTPQDRARFAAHVTVQNKVTPGAARALLAALAGTAPPSITAIGFDLHRYLGGPWESLSRHRFAG